jgi:hypothetical protein
MRGIMSDEPTILMAGQMAEFESRNYKGRHRRLKAGSIWLAEQEIERETWDLLETIPPGAIIHHVIWWSDGDATGKEQPEAEPVRCEHHATWNRGPCPECSQADPFEFGVKQDTPTCACVDCPEQYGGICPERPVEPEPVKPGPWGLYWSMLYAHKLMVNAPLIKALKVNGMGDSVKDALRTRLGVTSLTQARPDRLEAWLAAKGLQGALGIAREVRAKYEGKEDSAA